MKLFNYFSDKKNRKTLAAVSAVLVATSAVPLLFENCSASPTDTTASVASIAGEAPFAYNISVDTLAYMSCDGETTGNYTTGLLWSFKAAALGQNAGLQINPAFYNVASSLSTSQMIQTIEESPLSQGAYPQLAIRVPSYGMQAYLGTSSTGDGSFGMNPIDNGTNLQTMFGQPEYTWFNEFPTSSGTPTPLAAYIDFTTEPNDASAESVRQYVSSGNGFLAVDFTNSTLDTSPSGGALPAGSQSLYGVGFQFQFTAGTALNSPVVISSGTTRMVSAVQEYSLSTEQLDGATWSCPYHLMVVRAGNDAASYCPPNSVTQPPNTLLPHILPGWQINWGLGCAVPEAEGLCYGSTLPSTPINYTSSSCNTSVDNCPHYISICTRNP